MHTLSRRKFLRTVSASTGAMMLAPAWRPLDFFAGKGKKLGIALVGLGSYSTYELAPAFQFTGNCYLAGIVTGTPAKEKTWSEKYNIPAANIYNYQNFDSIAHNPAIDIVYVVLPVFMHKEYTMRAAAAGKHVICEKPMSMNAADCSEMIQACRKADRLLSIGYRLHFEPYTMEMMRLGQQKVFGELQSIECSNGFVWGGDPNAWRLKKSMAGGGGMMDMGIYTIQAARYVTGVEPVSVIAHEEKTKPDLFKEVDETIHYELEFPGGLVAHGSSSYNANWNDLKATAAKGWFELTEAYRYNGMKGATSNGPMTFDPNVNQQALQMDDFARCVVQNRPSRVAGEEGLKDMKVVDAIYRSIASGAKERI
ncbi:MAG TPA: Gfo/Idh/MocA family oxidoreductase [Puia sp.]|nr:Gfo/Idh/MocA family oxidoreductase [Puia sp.]